MARREVDWGPVRLDYESDLLTGDEIAKKHGVNRASMQRRAKAEGWQKNLSDRVQERTAAKLVAAASSPAAQGPGKQHSNRKGPDTPVTDTAPAPAPRLQGDPDEVAVEVAAAANVHIILTHRQAIARARHLTERLFGEAEAQFDDVANALPLLEGELLVNGKPLTGAQLVAVRSAVARAKDLPTRASTLKALTETMRLQVGLERQAFGIDKDDGGAGGDQTDFRTRILNARQRALDSRRQTPA
jgi:hypothetical protein